MEQLWKILFKVTDLILIKNKKYLQFKSKCLPNEIIPAGFSLSTDSSVKMSQKYVSQPYQEIDFYRLKTNLGIFEIKLITTKEKGRVFYSVYNVTCDSTFTLDERAFNLLFKHIDETYKVDYDSLKNKTKG